MNSTWEYLHYPHLIQAETEAPRISLEKLNPDPRRVVIIWGVNRDWPSGSIKRVQGALRASAAWRDPLDQVTMRMTEGSQGIGRERKVRD